MSSIFDVFRSGYLLGQQHGQAGERRRSDWEIKLTQPILWLPGVNCESYTRGYQAGYEDAMRLRSALGHIQR